MRRLLAYLTLIVGLGAATGCDPARQPYVEEPPPGFVALFNGSNLDGWHGMPHFDPRQLRVMSDEERESRIAEWTAEARRHWSVENGELVNDGEGPYLTTDAEYGDFELRLEYRTVPRADSGIYLRANPQVQIWDWTEEEKWGLGADKGSGGLWNNSPGAPGKEPLVRADRPFGEWNTFRIIMIGSRVTVWLNDQLVVDQAIMENFWDRSVPLWSRGPIQLQTHGGEIRWRNILLREIGRDEVSAALRRGGPARAEPVDGGFESIFNGRDFNGWAGPLDRNSVVDGTILSNHGTIYTEREYEDFVVRFEFLLPPAGNNGLAIRYPGEGDTAYVGMCEIQVLDDDHPQYAELDPRQYHGGIYGMIAPHRGFVRPPGEWNYQEVTVEGSRIRVELNGVVIVDGDVAEVTDFMGRNGDRYVGRTRTRGHFGFAGHGDPVRFRNIEIKEIG